MSKYLPILPWLLRDLVRRSTAIKKTLRGSPKLDIPLDRILRAVRRHGQLVAAARELRCSQAYFHNRMKEVVLLWVKSSLPRTWTADLG